MENTEDKFWERAEHILLHKTWDKLSAAERKIMVPFCDSKIAYEELRKTLLNVKRSFAEDSFLYKQKNAIATTLLEKFEKANSKPVKMTIGRKKIYYVLAAAAAIVMSLLVARQALITQNTTPDLAHKNQQKKAKEAEKLPAHSKKEPLKKQAEKMESKSLETGKPLQLSDSKIVKNDRKRNSGIKKDQIAENKPIHRVGKTIAQDSEKTLYADGAYRREKPGNSEKNEKEAMSNIAYNWGNEKPTAKDSVNEVKTSPRLISKAGETDYAYNSAKREKAKQTKNAKKRKIRQAFIFTDI